MVIHLTHISLAATLLAFLGACSVYKSNGRDAFESHAPGNVNTANISSTSYETQEIPVLKNETCWNQPASDPLWNLDATGFGEREATELVVSRLTTTEIQVCTRPID